MAGKFNPNFIFFEKDFQGCYVFYCLLLLFPLKIIVLWEKKPQSCSIFAQEFTYIKSVLY